MHTNGAEFYQKLSHAKDELSQLPLCMYDSADVNAILSAIGTKTELFFKAILFPTESPWRPFKYFINCLEGLVSEDELEELQTFRRTYNLARHNPRFIVGVIEALNQLKAVEKVVGRIFQLGIGMCNDPVSTSTKRVYWLCAWDHSIGQDTEIHIIVPGKSQSLMGPPELDMIRIESSLWARAKASLSAAGRVDKWEGHIPDEYVKAWKSLGDFIEAIAFEGEYRELLTCLAQFEKFIELKLETNRADSSKNVLVACLVALVDVISSVPDSEEIVDGITKQVTSTYALPESAADLAVIAEDLAQVARNAWNEDQTLTGPLWASRDEFNKLQTESIAESEKFPVIIDKNRRLIALHS